MLQRFVFPILLALALVGAPSVDARASDVEAQCPGHNPQAELRAQAEQKKFQRDRELLRMDAVLGAQLRQALDERLRALSFGRIRASERAAYGVAFEETRSCLEEARGSRREGPLDALCRALTGLSLRHFRRTKVTTDARDCAVTSPWPVRVRERTAFTELTGAVTNPLDVPAHCELLVLASDGRQLARLPLGDLRAGDARLFRRELPRMPGAEDPTSGQATCAWSSDERLPVTSLATYAGPRFPHPWQGGAAEGADAAPIPDLLPGW